MSKNRTKFENREKVHFIIAWVILLLFVSPMFILGENAHFRIHDNMDSNIAWYRTLVNSGQLFGSLQSSIPQIINGLPRHAYASEFTGIVWLHALFPSMFAYALSQTISHVFAFLGMYWLLKKHFLHEKEYHLIYIYVSLAFALTPFWPSGMLATLGMPLALWAFLSIRKNQETWKEWLTLILLPFYSSFVLGFFFFLAFMGFLWLWDFISKRAWNLKFFFSIALMTTIFLLIEYRLVYAMLFPDGLSNRTEFWSSRLTVEHCIRLSIKNYLIGHNHVMTLHTLVVVPISFAALWFVVKNKEMLLSKRYKLLFVFNILLSIWYAFWFCKWWQPLKESYSILNTFNFARFHFLRPMVIYLLFAIGCAILWKRNHLWRSLVKVALGLQVGLLFLANPEIVYRAYGSPSFKEFYAMNQFREIEKTIGKLKSSYRVVSIGLHPAIAEYNGFYTLDTYANYYPLSYKHQFRKIIAKELDKNRKIKDYFDHWGGRCYIFSSELGKKYDFRKDSRKKIKNLQLNTDELKKMGGQFIFSSVPILNYRQNNLDYIKTFDDTQSAWKIYLYKVK
ncbi:MAG: hypothetical protein K0R71_1524 [Bacillales bacterium]|nr:hypothetical protein [Bacillales bacterium]